jgi:hypothetical protein
MKKDPDFWSGGCTVDRQPRIRGVKKMIQSLTAVSFVAMLVAPGLADRFARSIVSLSAAVAGGDVVSNR